MLRARRVLVAGVAAFALGLLSSGCTDEPIAPEPGVVAPSLQRGPHVGSPILSSERTELGGDLAHYTYDVAVGDGPYDVIRLHRIVRERRPDKPVPTREAVFLLPGKPNSFEGIFVAPLYSQAIPPDHSIALFMAQNDIDVWGMDYAWALVPAEVTELDFMASWGLQRDIDHAAEAISIARSIRVSTGQGFGKVHLLGFSYGVFVAYPLVGLETLLPPGRRSVKGFVALDSGIKVHDETVRAYQCTQLQADLAKLAAGMYSDDTGLFLRGVSALATYQPVDPSPFFPGLTNLQAALFVGARTELLSARFWHFVGGILDPPFGIPSDLRYTENQLWLDLLGVGPPHLPTRVNADFNALICGEDEVPFDDHLGDITLPILQFGAAGGILPITNQTATLTASRDVTTVMVQLQADEDRDIDFGHADLVLARDAEALVWRPILDWVVDKSDNWKKGHRR